MKKYLLPFLLAVLIVFTSCERISPKEKRQADISSFFSSVSASFTASFKGLEAEGSLEYTPSALSLEFTKPETLSSLKMTADKNGVTASFKDFSVTKRFSSVTEKAAVNSVFSVMNEARLYGVLNKADGETSVSGEGYEIKLDEKNRVKKIVIPEQEISITLYYGE